MVQPPQTGASADLNADFVDPNLDVQRWVERFELESREIYSSRDMIVRQLGIRSGQRIADIGAGTGLFTRMFSAIVGDEGRVWAVEISPKFLIHIVEHCEKTGITNITPVLASSARSNLPPRCIDLAFICDTYHHFEQPAETLASIHQALVEGGELVVIDFERIPGQSRQWVIDHVRADKAAFRAEIEGAGFEFVDEPVIAGFSENYCLRFRKPAQ